MQSGIEFPIVIQLVFKYLNTNISIYDFLELEECKNLSIPFTKCLPKISSNKTIQYNGKKYLWSELSKKVREKMETDKLDEVIKLAIVYLDSLYSINDLAKLKNTRFSSSSIQRYFKNLIPKASKIMYHGVSYTGEEFSKILNEKMLQQKQMAASHGGQASAICTKAIRDDKGRFQGSEALEMIDESYSIERYKRSLLEAKSLLIKHSSTRMVETRVGSSRQTILNDINTVLKDIHPDIYEKCRMQIEENKSVDKNEKCHFLNAEVKYQKQKKKKSN